MSISIIGIGFVGGAMEKSFKEKGYDTTPYDKFKKIGSFEDTLKSSIMFLALPTVFSKSKMEYDKVPIRETCQKLTKYKYTGLVVIKSTVEPGTTENLVKEFPELKFIHNPEFLTAATAYEDFHNQKHIVLGKASNVNVKDMSDLIEFYSSAYPNAEISICSATESESMKSFVNCFYSVKIQFFNELYLTCKSSNCDYEIVKNLMLKNEWINPMHTKVPGTDGRLSYGGYCFPKDTNALMHYMKKLKVPHKVLQATIEERNEMRNDDINMSD